MPKERSTKTMPKQILSREILWKPWLSQTSMALRVTEAYGALLTFSAY